VQLGALTPGRIECFRNTRKKKGADEPLSAKSAQQMPAILQSSFAMKEGYVRRNIAQLADLPEVVPTKSRHSRQRRSPRCSAPSAAPAWSLSTYLCWAPACGRASVSA